MPYAIRRKGNRFQVVNVDTGEPKSGPTSRAKAEKQLKLLRAVEHGWTPTGESDTYTRTVNGKKHTLKVKG